MNPVSLKVTKFSRKQKSERFSKIYQVSLCPYLAWLPLYNLVSCVATTVQNSSRVCRIAMLLGWWCRTPKLTRHVQTRCQLTPANATIANVLSTTDNCKSGILTHITNVVSTPTFANVVSNADACNHVPNAVGRPSAPSRCTPKTTGTARWPASSYAFVVLKS